MKKKLVAVVCTIVLFVGGFGAWSTISRLKSENESLRYQIDTLTNKISVLNELLNQYLHPAIHIDVKLLEDNIREISELATMEYRYKEQYTFQGHIDLDLDDILKGVKFPLPLTDKELVVNMEGVIKAGIDFSRMSIRCDEKKKEIVVSLPEPKYLSNELDEENIEIVREKSALFNQLTTEDQNIVRQRIKKQAQTNADKNDILKQASERAELLIKDYIETTPDVKGNYKIRFVTIE